tara:strand:- start:243 stop:500 length:258 start_codon:yes stop_codon:yes gene_type:complete
MSKLNDGFIRLNQDFFLDANDIGKIISVIVQYGYYNMSSKYENCLLIELLTKDSLRPNAMTILWNGKLKYVSINNLNDIQVKFLS